MKRSHMSSMQIEHLRTLQNATRMISKMIEHVLNEKHDRDLDWEIIGSDDLEITATKMDNLLNYGKLRV